MQTDDDSDEGSIGTESDRDSSTADTLDHEESNDDDGSNPDNDGSNPDDHKW